MYRIFPDNKERIFLIVHFIGVLALYGKKDTYLNSFLMSASFNADLDVVDFIKAVFNNKTVQKYTQPFADKVTGWLKPLIRKKDAELATLLEERPDDPLADCKLRAISKDFESDPVMHLKLRKDMEEGRANSEQLIKGNKVKAKEGNVNAINKTVAGENSEQGVIDNIIEADKGGVNIVNEKK
jgi:hypothetical protein